MRCFNDRSDVEATEASNTTSVVDMHKNVSTDSRNAAPAQRKEKRGAMH